MCASGQSHYAFTPAMRPVWPRSQPVIMVPTPSSVRSS